MEVKEIQNIIKILAQESNSKNISAALRQANEYLSFFIAKKPLNIQIFNYVPENKGELLVGHCPSCGTICTNDMLHCEKCGQMVKWN